MKKRIVSSMLCISIILMMFADFIQPINLDLDIFAWAKDIFASEQKTEVSSKKPAAEDIYVDAGDTVAEPMPEISTDKGQIGHTTINTPVYLADGCSCTPDENGGVTMHICGCPLHTEHTLADCCTCEPKPTVTDSASHHCGCVFHTEHTPDCCECGANGSDDPNNHASNCILYTYCDLCQTANGHANSCELYICPECNVQGGYHTYHCATRCSCSGEHDENNESCKANELCDRNCTTKADHADNCIALCTCKTKREYDAYGSIEHDLVCPLYAPYCDGKLGCADGTHIQGCPKYRDVTGYVKICPDCLWNIATKSNPNSLGNKHHPLCPSHGAIILPADTTAITSSGGTLRSGTYTLTSNVQLGRNSIGFYIPSGESVTVDLNGFVLSRSYRTQKETAYADNIFTVMEGGSLTIIDSNPTTSHYGVLEDRTYGYSHENGQNRFAGFRLASDAVWVYKGDSASDGSVEIKGGLITGGVTGANMSTPDYYNYAVVGTKKVTRDSGGGAIVNYGTLVMNGGTIAGCESRDRYIGSAIFNKGDNATFTMNGGAIKYNYSDGGQGAVYARGYTAQSSQNAVVINDGILYHNIGIGHGAIFAYQPTSLTIGETGDALSDLATKTAAEISAYAKTNATSEVPIIDSNVAYSGCGTNGNGGGIYADSIAFTVNSAVISNNWSHYRGGGIDIYGGGTLTIGKATRIISNYCERFGGGISLHKGSGTKESLFTLADGVDVSYNKSGFGAGIMLSSVDTATVGAATINNNTATGSHIWQYGCVKQPSEDFDSPQSIITMIAVDGTVLDPSTEDLTGLTRNVLSASGAGLYFSASVNATFTGTEIVNNVGAKHGGAIYMPSGTVVLDGVDISGNKVTGENCRGGGIYIHGTGDVTIKGGSKIENNRAEGGGTSYGGGIYVNGIDSEIALVNGSISNNFSGSNGGGVFVAGNNCTFTVAADGKIDGNQSYRAEGGGVYLSGKNAVFTLNGGAITNNRAHTVDNSGGGTGGGIRMYGPGGTFTMNGGTLSGNRAETDHGGALCINDGCTVNFNGGVIENNFAMDNGGVAYLNKGSVVNVKDGVTIQNNTANDNYGAVFFINQGTVNVEGGLFKNNTGHSGGAVWLYGTESSALSKFNMTGGRFENNTSTHDSGGAVTVQYGTATIKNGVFIDNKANTKSANPGYERTYGGAVAVLYGNCTVENSYFIGNSAGEGNNVGRGGAVGVSGGTLVSTNNVYIGNSATENGGAISAIGTTTVTGGVLYNNHCVKYGGALYTQSDNLTIQNISTPLSADEIAKINGFKAGTVADGVVPCGITENYTDNNTGGAITVQKGNTAITETVFTENRSGNAGGALYVDTGTVTITGGSFTKNKTNAAYGGAIGMNTGDITITGTAQTPVAFSDNYATGAGGAIGIAGTGNVTAQYVDFNENNADNAGAVLSDNGVLRFTDCNFTNNVSRTGDGGAIRLYTAGSQLHMTRGTIVDNSARAGGAVYMNGGDNVICELTGVTVTDNTASANGGAVAIASVSTFKATGCSIENNSSGVNGGAVYIAGGSDTVVCELTDTTLRNNTASANGGAVCIAAASTFKAERCTFSQNHADSRDDKKGIGGAVYVEAADVDIIDCTVSENTAGRYAGGLFGRTNCTVDLHDSYFYNNVATDEMGGAVCIEAGTVNVYGGIFDQNQTLRYSGGAISVGIKVGNNPALNISDSQKYSGETNTAQLGTNNLVPVFTENYASNLGGAIFMFSGTVNVNSADMNNNKAKAYGGAIGLYKGTVNLESGAKLTYNTSKLGGAVAFCRTGGTINAKAGAVISYNNATNNGGAFYFDNNSGGSITEGSNLNIAGATVTYNSTSGYNGGAVYMKAGTVNMTSGTIDYNTAVDTAGTHQDHDDNFKGGAVYMNGGSFEMSGGTVSNNTSSDRGGAVYMNGGSFEMSGGSINNNKSLMFSAGAVYLEQGIFTMTGGEMKNNTANTDGGAVCINKNGILTMSGGTISQNTAMNNGGAIYMGGDNAANVVTISGSAVISDNMATTGSGGGIYIDSQKLVMNGGTITRNNAEEPGGGVYMNNDFSMSQGTVSYNTSSYDGGGMYINKGNFVMEDGTFEGNTTAKRFGEKINEIESGSLKGLGGAIFIRTSNEHTGTAVIKKGTFTNNSAEFGGGAIYIGDRGDGGNKNTTKTDRLVLGTEGSKEGPLFVGNHLLFDGSKYANGENCEDANGDGEPDAYSNSNKYQTDIGGGAVYMKDGNFVMHYATFDSNKTNETPGDYLSGGAVFIQNGNFTMHDGVFKNNFCCHDKGGAVYIDGKESVFTMLGGTATGNGARDNGGFMRMQNGTVYIHGGTITQNKAELYSGGGIELNEGSFYMCGGEISDNTAKDYGGGVCIRNSTQVKIYDGKITHNTTSGKTTSLGGGICVINAANNVYVYGGEISYNHSSKNGGGIYAGAGNIYIGKEGCVHDGNHDGCSPTISDFCDDGCASSSECPVITNNTTDGNGGGIYVTKFSNGSTSSGNVYFYCGELSGNSAKGNGGGISVDNNGQITLDYVVIKDNTTDGSVTDGTNIHLNGGTVSYTDATKIGFTENGVLKTDNPGVIVLSGTFQNTDKTGDESTMVSVYLLDGETVKQQFSVPLGSVINLPDVFSMYEQRDGYTFVGWQHPYYNEYADAPEDYKPTGAPITVVADKLNGSTVEPPAMTLVAVWAPSENGIRYYSSHAATDVSATDTYNYNKGEQITVRVSLPDAPYVGYTVNSWVMLQDRTKNGNWNIPVSGKAVEVNEKISTVNANGEALFGDIEFVASWTATVKYYAVGHGSVSVADENVTVGATSTNVLGGSVATADTYYEFVGWYTDAECTGDPISTDAHCVPVLGADGFYAQLNYYAKFELRYIDLTIQANGIEANQSYVYTVTGGENDTTMQIIVTADADGSGSTTIKHIAAGEYKVFEHNCDGSKTPVSADTWTWRYTKTKDHPQTKTVIDKPETVTFEYTEANIIYWLSHFAQKFFGVE